jgi:hypothetical protein
MNPWPHIPTAWTGPVGLPDQPRSGEPSGVIG